MKKERSNKVVSENIKREDEKLKRQVVDVD
jgi:hypothetical protein